MNDRFYINSRLKNFNLGVSLDEILIKYKCFMCTAFYKKNGSIVSDLCTEFCTWWSKCTVHNTVQYFLRQNETLQYTIRERKYIEMYLVRKDFWQYTKEVPYYTALHSINIFNDCHSEFLGWDLCKSMCKSTTYALCRQKLYCAVKCTLYTGCASLFALYQVINRVYLYCSDGVIVYCVSCMDANLWARMNTWTSVFSRLK